MIDDLKQRITIGGKEVFLSQRYHAVVAEMVGRPQELELITAAWLAGRNELPLAPLLVGEPGVGKNRLVYEVAQRTSKELYIFQGHEDVTAEDLACSVRFSDDSDRKMDYVLSPLVTAMREGGICFIDEIAKIRPRALALLVSVLDERRYIDSTLLGERVEASESFRFIAATNTADLEGNALPEFLRSRMRPVIKIGYPSQEEVSSIIRKRCPRLGDRAQPLIETFWLLWDRYDSRTPPTPRDAIYVFSLALSLADYDYVQGRTPMDLSEVSATPTIETRHLERAFAEIFND